MVTGKIAAGAKAVKGATSEAVSAGKELFKPAVEKVTKSFFNGRVMFASDFPLLHCMLLLVSDRALSGIDSRNVTFE